MSTTVAAGRHREYGRHLLWISVLATAIACAPPEPPPRLLVLGVDGADLDVLEQLWARDELPVLRDLARRGVVGELQTDYGMSPVIWTTIVTGRGPEHHGINGFQVQTPDGRYHASTDLRRVPALWNILDLAGKRTAVLGWWPSWPAEAINGIVVSDRAEMDIEDRVSPGEFLARWNEIVAEAEREESPYPWGRTLKNHGRATLRAARTLAGDDFELMLVYLREIDIASHLHWDQWQPEAFGEPCAESRWSRPVPELYRALDHEVARLLETIDPRTNVFIISDHGFEPDTQAPVHVNVDMQFTLSHLGLVTLDSTGKVDCGRSPVVPIDTMPSNLTKQLKLCPGEQLAHVRELLSERLEGIRYFGGSRVFSIRDPEPAEKDSGTDLVIEVHTKGASNMVLVDGKPRRDLVLHVGAVPGRHGPATHGIFLAAGPDIRANAPVDGIGIHDVASTALFALGMPVAEDSLGRPWVELFTDAFRDRHPPRTVSSWGTREPSRSRPHRSMRN